MQTAEAEGREQQLKGKVAVVTGGGSGVGKAIAELFAQNGCAVMVVDVVPDRVSAVVGGLKASGARASGLVADLSKPEESDKMIDRAIVEFGRVDVLCNNAGIMDGAMPAAETTDALWEKIMSINLDAPFRASRKVIPTMLKQGGGAIINTASVAGLFGGIAGAAYTVSKHGLIGLTRSVAAQYGSKGIRCNAMVLGGVNTNIGIGSSQPDKGALEHLMKVAAMMPRTGDPKEIAELALFLASGRSSFVNGACVVIDGGWTVF
jgi:NAD(P)-dependent dehydrogenase (short-subunit alcohol dehydrogenase family)